MQTQEILAHLNNGGARLFKDKHYIINENNVVMSSYQLDTKLNIVCYNPKIITIKELIELLAK